MATLTGFDAKLLQVEEADPNANFAVAALAVMAGPLPDRDALHEALAQRLATDRRFRQVVRRYPFDLARPRAVVVDEDFAEHVHHIGVPRPGDDQALFALVSDVMSWRLHHGDPLWECWVLEGLSENRWAILLKTHSSIADEAEVMRMLTRLTDDEEADPQIQRDDNHVMRTLNPLRWAGGAWRTSAALTAAAARVIADTVGGTRGGERPAECPLTGHVTSLRRYASVELSLADVAKVCDAFDVTAKDIALAAMSGSYRNLLMRHGRPTHCGSLRALVPTSTHARAAVALPVDESDPVRQLRKAQTRLTRTDGPSGAGVIHPFSSPAGQDRHALAWLPQRGAVALTPIDSGPAERLRFIGQDIVRLLPIPAIGPGTRTGLAMVSYAGKLVVGVTSDDEARPEVGELARGIEQTLARLSTISASARRSNKKTILYLLPGEPTAIPARGRRDKRATNS
ncbi:wax ester/triacylglycerol synthase domain-containing protein [Mycolicibacterium sp. XJ2546]